MPGRWKCDEIPGQHFGLFDVTSHGFKVCECESGLRVECQQSRGWMGMGGGEKRLRVRLFNDIMRNKKKPNAI